MVVDLAISFLAILSPFVFILYPWVSLWVLTKFITYKKLSEICVNVQKLSPIIYILYHKNCYA